MDAGKLIGKGVAFDLLQFIMDKYNFTYEIVPHDRNIIGSQEDFSGSLLHSLYSNVRRISFAFRFFSASHFLLFDRSNHFVAI